MAVIVINSSTRRDPTCVDQDGELPLLAVTSGVDSGYVIQYVAYFVSPKEPLGVFDSECEYSRPGNPVDFHIGQCRFVKRGDDWFHLWNDKDSMKVVYGQQALEDYASGKMFERLTRMFGGD